MMQDDENLKIFDDKSVLEEKNTSSEKHHSCNTKLNKIKENGTGICGMRIAASKKRKSSNRNWSFK